MKLFNKICILCLCIICCSTNPTQAAIVYSYDKVTPRIEKKVKPQHPRKLKKRLRFQKSLKLKQARQHHQSPESKKAITYIILASVATILFVGILLGSLSFLFSIPATLGIVLAIAGIVIAILAIIFWINGFIYLSKAIRKKRLG
ncbi:hypothetical protein [Aureispira sp. CCB-QB1]|uniref:hypothetical protein n=1 Tax=Aureispira sp. CCB-QB1 TaxID=1313421 RepID=UPI00069904B3|nr:hypothetical protein [Aureispira sp. CCB-QB1]